MSGLLIAGIVVGGGLYLAVGGVVGAFWAQRSERCGLMAHSTPGPLFCALGLWPLLLLAVIPATVGLKAGRHLAARLDRPKLPPARSL